MNGGVEHGREVGGEATENAAQYDGRHLPGETRSDQRRARSDVYEWTGSIGFGELVGEQAEMSHPR